MKEPEHPMQPVILDESGVARFKANAIVRYLLDLCQVRGISGMNELALIPFSREDREQFAQLIGYSVSGAGDLSYVSEEVIVLADAEVTKLVAAKKFAAATKGKKT